MCCLISIYLWISYFPFIIDLSFLYSVVREYTLYDFQLFKNVLRDLLYGLTFGLSWTIFHVQWRKVCILLLGGVLCRYFLGLDGLQCCLSLPFPFDLLPSCSTHYWKWVIECVMVYFSLQFCQCLLCIFGCSDVRSLYINNCYISLVYWTFYLIKCPFLLLSFWLVCFVWY